MTSGSRYPDRKGWQFYAQNLQCSLQIGSYVLIVGGNYPLRVVDLARRSEIPERNEYHAHHSGIDHIFQVHTNESFDERSIMSLSFAAPFIV